MSVRMIDPPTVNSSSHILGLLRRQAALFVRLEQFALRQRDLVRADDAGPLLSLLADRQKLSCELTDIAARLAPLRAAWPAFRESLTDPDRAEADHLVRDSSRRLQQVIESDETDARFLSVRRQALAGEPLATCTCATGWALAAYGGSPQPLAATRPLDETT